MTLFKQKQFIYPMTTSCMAIIAIIVFIIYVIIVKIKQRNKNTKLPTIRSRSDLECNLNRNCTTTTD